MKVVIDIPENDYKLACNYPDALISCYAHYIKKGKQPATGEWLRMSDLSENDDDRYKCSRCGNVIHHKSRMDLYTFNSWCGRCGSDNTMRCGYTYSDLSGGWNMSYDIRLGVKVEGMDGYIATIDEPEYSSPTYNLRDMFVACMDWDYEQGEWYNCGDVFQNIIRGQNEITAFPEKYEKYNAPNGWGTVSSAKKCIDSIVQKIGEITSGGWTWNEIPLEHLWIRW